MRRFDARRPHLETVGPDVLWTLLLVDLVIAPIGTAIYLGRKAFRR